MNPIDARHAAKAAETARRAAVLFARTGSLVKTAKALHCTTAFVRQVLEIEPTPPAPRPAPQPLRTDDAPSWVCRSLHQFPVTVREAHEWLIEARAGLSPEYLARKAAVPVSTVIGGVQGALRREERLERSMRSRLRILFPIGEPFSPTARCRHPKPIPDGERCYCPCCHASGWDAELASLEARPYVESPAQRRGRRLRESA